MRQLELGGTLSSMDPILPSPSYNLAMAPRPRRLATALCGAALLACGEGSGAGRPAHGAADGDRSIAAEIGDVARTDPAGPPAPERAPAGAGQLDFRPSIVLVTIDTLRRDHLGCYGYFRDTSPRIDALAAESVLFERALASMATTFPSHLSMLTGLYPHQHGKTSNRRSVREPFRSGAECRSVAAALASAGWETAAFVGSSVLHPRTGIGDGFRTFLGPEVGEGPRNAARTTDKALAWLARNAGAPFFLWVHYWDVHEPNRPARAYASLFASDPALAGWIARRGIDAEELAGTRALEDKPPASPRPAARRHDEPPTVVDRAYVEDLWNRYDGCVREVDDQVGRLIDDLRARELWQRTIFAVTSDHGQSLGEDGAFGHGRITNVNVLVPLVIRFPAGVAGAPRRIPELVSLIDLMPTILARVEEPLLGDFLAQVEGEDVLSGGFSRPFACVQRASQFARHKNPLECALVSGRWKLIQREDGPEELYDLEGAGESVDVLAAHPDVAAELQGELRELWSRVPRRAEAEAADPAEVEALLEEL